MTKQKILCGLHCQDKRMIYKALAESLAFALMGSKKLLKAVILESGKLCSPPRPWFQLEVPAQLCVHQFVCLI